MQIKKLIPYIIRKQINLFLVKQKHKNKNVYFGKNVIVDRRCIFEGYNTLQDNVRIGRSFLGRGSYIANGSIIGGAKIGRFCSIGGNVRIGLGRHPTKNFVSTSPSFFSATKQNGLSFVNEQLFEEHIYIDKEKRYFCEIGNDVWIGNNVMIMDGIHIGDGAVIAGGAVVTKDVEPYTIVGGLPAKPIKKRFTDIQIQQLLQIKWWNWDLQKLKENAGLFMDIEKFIKYNIN